MESPAVELSQILKERFRLNSFREGQEDIIKSVIANRDAMAVMPTGRGKSLCYQLPTFSKKGIVVVVSPLIALMQDQVRALKALGLPAGCLHSGQSYSDKKEIFKSIQNSDHFLLYLSPERVQNPGFSQWILKQPISLFAIDEAHCVSQWGPDFREDYYRLSILRKIRPDVPILALTATATPIVLSDISKQLGLLKPDRHIHGFYRPNLYFQVEPCDSESEKLAWTRQAIRQNSTGRILIYVGTRQNTEDLSLALQDITTIGKYHAGMSPEDRKSIQEEFSVGKFRTLVCTNAFGMGVDYPDIRLVVHYQLPANIESFYQEMGRAGRDGNPSTCLLLYSKKDKGLQSYFIRSSGADKHTLNRRWRALDTIVQFAEGGDCRHSEILTYFRDSKRIKNCGHCDSCNPKSPLRIIYKPISFAAPKPKEKEARIFKSKTSSKKIFDNTSLTPEEMLRSEILKTWRKQYSDERDIPAFLVFSNKTLHMLAKKNPKTLSELETVYGIGQQKAQLLGKEILEQLSVL